MPEDMLRLTLVATMVGVLAIPVPGWAQTVTRNPPPPTPWIAFGECPGEGCTLERPWTACTTVVVRTEKREDAPVAFTLHRGERVTLLHGDVHVELPGLVVFRDTVTYHPRSWAPSHDSVHFTPGDTLYLLNYLGEGHLVWWLRGHADTGQVFWWTWPEPDPDPARRAALVRRTRAVWWVRVRNGAGSEGWLIPGFSTGRGYDIGLPLNCGR